MNDYIAYAIKAGALAKGTKQSDQDLWTHCTFEGFTVQMRCEWSGYFFIGFVNRGLDAPHCVVVQLTHSKGVVELAIRSVYHHQLLSTALLKYLTMNEISRSTWRISGYSE